MTPARDQLVQHRGQLFKLVKVRRSQLVEAAITVGGEPHPDDPPVAVVARAPYQTSVLGPVDKLDGTVMTQQQVLSQIADRRSAPAPMTLDG